MKRISLSPSSQGLTVWGLGLALALLLPGTSWQGPAPSPFPWHAMGPALLAISLLALAAPLAVWHWGPALATQRTWALLEAPPDLLWAALILACWPATWGPPGLGGWILAFLAAALPGEARWLAQALPREHPFPEAWGHKARLRMRHLALTHLWGRWLAVRLPLWLTATLIIERALGVPGLGTDWLGRVAGRDRLGMAAWVLALALLWLLSQPFDKETA